MRLNPSRTLPLFSLFLLVSSASAGASFRISVDSSKAPQCEAFTRNAKVLVEEWYPKINEILFSPDHPLPASSIAIICEPLKAIAYTDIEKNIIHLSAAYVTEKAPDDYGMVIHELTHIVQHYNKLKPSEVWLQEGIADYVRHRYFEGDLDRLTIDPGQSSYRQGYKPAALFLAWLQRKKDPNLVHNLNEACSQGHCGPDLFVRFCGTDVEMLWSQFESELPRNASGKK
jgi:hypothetical protein